MIAYLHKYLANIPAVFIDGTLYALIALFTFNQTYFGGDEAAKYIEPQTKFWMNWFIGACATVFASIKAFRSTSYASHKADKEEQK